jgi:hypothetical protein
VVPGQARATNDVAGYGQKALKGVRPFIALGFTMIDDVSALPKDYFALVGNIASDWATLEYMINKCIWDAAMLDEQLGACITAQISSPHARLEALHLLLRARGVSDALLASVSDYKVKIRKAAEKRHRAVHDPLGIDKDDGEPRQLQITAHGKLVFERRKVTTTSLQKDLDLIADWVNKILDLQERIVDELVALPPYEPRPLFPMITRGRHPTLPPHDQ